MKTNEYPNGWYDLMDGSRRINRMRQSGEDAKANNSLRDAAGTRVRWVYGKQPGRPKNKS